MTTSIHSCPACGLRFTFVAELTDHMRRDHRRADAPPEDHHWDQITVPVDPSRDNGATIGVATMIAQQAGMGVALVAAPGGGVDSSGTEAYLRAQALVVSEDDGPKCSWHLLASGDLAGNILQVAGEGDTTLLCMATHSRGAVAEMLFGSVSEDVMRNAPVPVVLVGPHADAPKGPYSHVVVAYDSSDTADRAVDRAAALAPRLGTDIALIEVLDPGVQLPDDVSETSAVRRAAHRLPASRTTWDVTHDRDPASGIVTMASEQPNPLIIVGTHGHSGLRRVTLGSVALDVVRKATCPVIVVPGLDPLPEV